MHFTKKNETASVSFNYIYLIMLGYTKVSTEAS